MNSSFDAPPIGPAGESREGSAVVPALPPAAGNGEAKEPHAKFHEASEERHDFELSPKQHVPQQVGSSAALARLTSVARPLAAACAT